MSAATKTTTAFYHESEAGPLTEMTRKLVYARAGLTAQQTHQLECMVADSATRVVGQGALDNMRCRVASKKNDDCRVVESHTCERVFAYELELGSAVLGYYAQVPCRGIFRYRTDGGSHVSNATLDFLVFYENRVELVECKTESWLVKNEREGEWERTNTGWTSCPYRRWAAEKGLRFRVWTPPHPVAIYLRNLEAVYALVKAPLSAEEGRVAQGVASLIAKRPHSLEELSALVIGFRERIALWLMANGQCYGLMRSTPIHRRDQFVLYADKKHADTADHELLGNLMDDYGACVLHHPLHLATVMDYRKSQERFDRLNRIASGEEKSTRRMSELAREVREAIASGTSALSACLTSHAKKGNRLTRLDPVQDECIEWAISNLWNRGKVKNRKTLWFCLEEECHRRDVKVPHQNTLNRRLKREDVTRRALATGGMRAYQAVKPSSDPRYRSGIAIGYGHTLHIDSSQFDNLCITEHESEFLGEMLWFYVGIDEATGMPMAHALIFGRARTLGLAILIRNFIERHGFLPACIVVDRGSENESNWLKRFCLEAGITLIYSPTGGSRFNSQAENCIKQINHGVAHDLPGSRLPDMKGRSVDGKFKSKKTAKITYMALSKALEDYVYGDLPKTPDGNDATPIEKRDESIARYGLLSNTCKLDDDMRIKTAVPIRFTGKATEKRGIRTGSGAFTSDELKALLRTNKPEEVRQDCIDWSLLYVRIKNVWVKAFHSAVLTQATLTKVEKLFESLYRPVADATRRKTKQDIDRDRHQRHGDIIAAAQLNLPLNSSVSKEAEAPESDDPSNELLSEVNWDEIDVIETEASHV